MIKSIFSGILFLLISLVGYSQAHYEDLMSDLNVNFYAVCDSAESYFKNRPKGKGSGYKNFLRWKAENAPRYFPTGERNHVKPTFAVDNYTQIQASLPSKSERSFQGVWQELGPWQANNITEGYNPGIGRVETFWVDPANDQHFLVGSRSGGLWMSTNGGANWLNTTDTLVASGVNTVAVNPFGADTVLINVRNGRNGATHGIYQSVDGGMHWTLSNFNNQTLGWGGLGTNDQVFKIAYHPTIPNTLFIGTSKGVFKSTDHLQTWTQEENTADITDIEFHPTNPDVIYLYDNYYWSANSNKILISVDGGASYTPSSTIAGNNNAKGFISVNPQAPNNVFFASDNGVWKSTNQGVDFTLLSVPTEGCDGFAVSDVDSNVMLYGYLNIQASLDHGSVFNDVTSWANTNPGTDYTHADLRTAECINGVFYVGTDGYFAKSEDNGTTWQRLNDGTAIREFYAAGVSQSHHQYYMAGSQDNGTSILNPSGWIEWNGGDGMEALVHTLNKDWMIGSWQYGTRQFTRDGGLTREGANNPEGGTSDWQAPLLYDPNNQMDVYHFASKIYLSSTFGTNWVEIGDPNLGNIQVAEIAYTNPQLIAVSRNQIMKLSKDGGQSFNFVNGLSGSAITDIAISPINDSVIVVTHNRYENDGKKVYLSTNQGSSWTNITYNLGNMPINTVVIDHSDQSYIYVGAEIGAYVMPLNGTQWEEINPGLPNVSVTDLEVQWATNTLKATTWGRGLWQTTLKGRELYPAIDAVTITDTPTDIYPKAGSPQTVTATISYSNTVKSAFVKWSAHAPTFENTLPMNLVSDSTWATNDPIDMYQKYTKMYFKVYAVGQNNDTTESYKFQYTVRSGLNIGIIENQLDKTIQLYPNPNNGQFTLHLNSAINGTVQITNLLGQQLFQEEINGVKKRINTTLPAGVYILELIENGKSAKIKYIVQ